MKKFNEKEILKAIEKKNTDIIKTNFIIGLNNEKVLELIRPIDIFIEKLCYSKSFCDKVIGEQYRVRFEKIANSLSRPDMVISKIDILKLMDLIGEINKYDQTKKKIFDCMHNYFEEEKPIVEEQNTFYGNGCSFESNRKTYGLNVANAIDEFFKEKEYEQE